MIFENICASIHTPTVIIYDSPRKQKSNNKTSVNQNPAIHKDKFHLIQLIVCLPEQDHPLKWKMGCPLPSRKYMFENTALFQITETAKQTFPSIKDTVGACV